jgi:predicted RNA-binding protein
MEVAVKVQRSPVATVPFSNGEVTHNDVMLVVHHVVDRFQNSIEALTENLMFEKLRVVIAGNQKENAVQPLEDVGSLGSVVEGHITKDVNFVVVTNDGVPFLDHHLIHLLNTESESFLDIQIWRQGHLLEESRACYCLET